MQGVFLPELYSEVVVGLLAMLTLPFVLVPRLSGDLFFVKDRYL